MKDDLSKLDIPLTFAENRFIVVDGDGKISQMKPLTAQPHAHTSSINSVSREDIEAANLQRDFAPKYPEDVSDAGMSASATSTMENMVNSLTQPEVPQRFARNSTLLDEALQPALKTPTAQSFVERGAFQEQAQPISFVTGDTVQQIHRSLSSSFASVADSGSNRPVLPSIMNSPFAPLPGETPGSSPRPNAAQRHHAPFTVSPQTRQFQANLVKQQHQVQLRTSPADSPQPTMSSKFETPSNQTSWIRTVDQLHPVLSPWQSSSYQSPALEVIIPNRPLEPAPFGAIGESRPKSSGGPSSGQHG